jgi:hypothetical protein
MHLWDSATEYGRFAVGAVAANVGYVLPLGGALKSSFAYAIGISLVIG